DLFGQPRIWLALSTRKTSDAIWRIAIRSILPVTKPAESNSHKRRVRAEPPGFPANTSAAQTFGIGLVSCGPGQSSAQNPLWSIQLPSLAGCLRARKRGAFVFSFL